MSERQTNLLAATPLFPSLHYRGTRVSKIISFSFFLKKSIENTQASVFLVEREILAVLLSCIRKVKLKGQHTI